MAPLPVYEDDPRACFELVHAAMGDLKASAPGGRRGRAHRAGGLRAADDRQPGRARAGAPAVLQPRRDERPGPAAPAVPARAPHDSRSTRSRRSPRTRRSCVAIMSYCGRLCFGLLADYDAVPDLGDLVDDLEGAMFDLARAAETERHPWRMSDARSAARLGAHARRRAGRALLTMRIALAQINPVVGDVAGNERTIRARLAEARDGGRAARAVPRARDHSATRPRTCCSRSTSCADARAALERHRRRRRTGIVAVVGFPERAEDVYNAAARARRRRGPRRSTARTACRTTASSTSTATSSAATAAAVIERRRRARRADRLRGHLGPGTARERRGARRRAADREHLRLAVPRRQGPGARADDRPACAGHARLRRVLRAGRRPGRARLRRPLVRRRPHGRRRRPRAAVRGGAAAVHASTSRPPAPRACATRATGRSPSARTRASTHLGSFASGRPSTSPTHPRASSRRCSAPTTRSTRRSCSGRATTSRRTDSSTSCSGSPAGSTRRSSRVSRSTRWGPNA